MRLDRARTTALLAAAVLTTGAWVATAPAASAGFQDDVETCLAQSATYQDFKDCYGNVKSEKDKQSAQAAKERQARKDAQTPEDCEKAHGLWLAQNEVCQ